MSSKHKAARRERKNKRFTQKHQDLPINLNKFASRTAWAKEKRALRKLNVQDK